MDKQDIIGWIKISETSPIRSMTNKAKDMMRIFINTFLLVSISLLVLSCSAKDISQIQDINGKPDAYYSSPTINRTSTTYPNFSKTPTPELTVWPTLNPSEQLSWIDVMMNGKDRCMFPCWLGITPGESTREFVLNQLTNAGFWLDHFYSKGHDNYEILLWPVED